MSSNAEDERSVAGGWIPDVPGGLYVPTRQVHERQGKIRWAVGSPEGPRSQTWVLVGRPDGSVYIGPREDMEEIKLSLHPVKWRMALTEKAAAQRIGADENPLIEHFEKPPEFHPGWRRAACIVVAMSNLGVGYPEKKPKPGRIGWFSLLPLTHAFRFDVLIAEPGSANFKIPLYSEVGRIDFTNGWKAWIIASVTESSVDYERKMADLRLAARRARGSGLKDRTFIWGKSDEDQAPLIFDLSHLSSEGPPRTLDVRWTEDFPGVRTVRIPSSGSS